MDPMKPTLEVPGSERLKLKCDDVLLNIAFNINLRRYIAAVDAPAAAGLTCPPAKSFADAMALIETKDYAAALAIFNLHTLCAHDSKNETVLNSVVGRRRLT